MYQSIFEALFNQGFSFKPFAGFVQHSGRKVIVLRHDVDKTPENSLKMAQLEASLGVQGSYYFRTVPCSYNEEIIHQVAELGHEIGYHYETMDTVCKKIKDKSKKTKVIDYDLLVDTAYEEFCRNLEIFHKIVPIVTICMHGSPLSKYDNRAIWKKHDYKKLGIIAEPYFDVDFEEVLYLTDTGRRWDGDAVNIRDKAAGRIGIANGRLGDWETGLKYSNWKVKPGQGSLMNMTQQAIDFQNKYKFRSTFDIIKGAEEGKLPDKIMMTLHPQRWTDRPVPWVRELIWQNLKNVGKYFLVKLRDWEFGISD